jgi:hypothetical protein
LGKTLGLKLGLNGSFYILFIGRIMKYHVIMHVFISRIILIVLIGPFVGFGCTDCFVGFDNLRYPVDFGCFACSVDSDHTRWIVGFDHFAYTLDPYPYASPHFSVFRNPVICAEIRHIIILSLVSRYSQ